MGYRFAVLRHPGVGARIVEFEWEMTEDEAWDYARRACTPSERVDVIRETRAGAENAIQLYQRES